MPSHDSHTSTAAGVPARRVAIDASSKTPTMRALFKHHAGPELQLDANRSMPVGSHGKSGEPGPGEVLVRVHKAGVCGTDRHIWEWDDWAASRIPVGIVTGHEFVGTVEKVGSIVTACKPGDRVSGESHISAMNDFNARTGNAHIARDMQILGVDRDGIFADYVIIPESNVWPVHPDIPDDIAAVFDPLGNAVHTVMEAGVSTKHVLITGTGIIGLMAVTVARAAGAAKIFATDIDPRRRELAKKLGADEVFDPRDADGPDGWLKTIDRHTPGDGVDVLLEMAGHPTSIDQGFRALRHGGTAALLGIPSRPFAFDLTNHVVFKGAKVLGINGRRMWDTWYQMEALVLSGRLNLKPIITHVLPMAEFPKAFELMQSGEGIKVVLDINGPTGHWPE